MDDATADMSGELSRRQAPAGRWPKSSA